MALFHHDHAYHGTHPLKPEAWRNLAVLFFIALGFLYLFGHDRYLLFDVDEAIFTQATVEMMERNNYVLPTYNGEPRYHKPPLIYWAQAISLYVFKGVPYVEGLTEQAARLVSGIAAWGAVLVLYLTVLNLTQRHRLALTTAVIFGLNLSWLVVARAATADALLNFLILASTGWLLYMLYLRKGGFIRQLIAGLLLGLGILAKGPVALVVPAVVIGLAGLCRPQFFQSLRLLNPLVILPACFLTLAPWALAVMQQTGVDFFREFILVHNLGRFSEDMGNTHSNSLFYYLIVILIGFFPWSLLLILALPSSLRYVTKNLRSPDAQHALQPLALFWFLSIVMLFSFSGTKLAHYIVPALPAAALLIAYWLEKLSFRDGRSLLLWLGIPLTLTLAAVFAVLNRLLIAARPGVEDPLINTFGFTWPPTDDLSAAILAQVIPLNLTPLVVAFLLLFGVVLGLRALAKKQRPGVIILALTQFCWLSLVIVGLMPVVSAYTQRPLAQMGEVIHQRATPETQVFHYALHKPSVRLVSQTPFQQAHATGQLEGKLENTHTLILAEAYRLPEVEALLPADTPTKKVCTGGYCVLEVGGYAQEEEPYAQD